MSLFTADWYQVLYEDWRTVFPDADQTTMDNLSANAQQAKRTTTNGR